MKKTCENCKLLIKNKHINNCLANIVGTVRPGDGPCYKIQNNEIE